MFSTGLDATRQCHTPHLGTECRPCRRPSISCGTADELDEMRQRGEGQTDWDRVNTLTEEEIEASIDYEDEGEFDFSTAQPGLPDALTQRTALLDPDIVAWFKAQGPDYHTRMNEVLRDDIGA